MIGIMQKSIFFTNLLQYASCPFIVETSDLPVQALGTACELFSYARDKRREVILLNGKVIIGGDDPQTKQAECYMMDPNEKLRIDIKNNKEKKR